MGNVPCGSCRGSGKYYPKSGKVLVCSTCGGSGSNKNLWSIKCERCRSEIIYKANTQAPRFCKDCRNVELTKNCAQPQCKNRITYKVGWSNVSDYCKNCDYKRKNGFSASSCPGLGIMGCGNIIWSPRGKKFELCVDCSARKKAANEAKMREKLCPGLKGSSCGNKIRYSTDWDHPPNLCPQCKEKSKTEKVKNEAKMREKKCATNTCSNMVRYSTDWDHPPSYCKTCKDKRAALKAKYPNILTAFETRDLNYVMPGMGKTIGQMNGVRGKHYPRQGKIHCMVFEGMLGDDLHYSWDVDMTTGDVIGQVYMHPNNPRG